ncbi:MAG: hypothetical protein ACXW38_03595 [Nitrospira sp.]
MVIPKSLREGFGLVVSEALCKEQSVVVVKAGGIPMQFPEPRHRCRRFWCAGPRPT